MDYANRKPKLRFWPVAALVALFMAIAPVPAPATTMVATNLAQLSEAAESAFVVRIQSTETTTTADGTSHDVITGTVIEPVFGNVKTSQTISWNQFRLGKNVPVPSMPAYEAGKEYLVFLAGKGPGTGLQAPIGLGQGVFLITRNPRTGAASARNAYMNATVARGLNVEKAAQDMVEHDPKTRALPAQQKSAEVNKLKMQLMGRGGQNLESFKSAAQFFHSRKQSGASPSMDYRTTAPVQLMR